ncbi:hypothetical protein [Larkinella arboricola]|uniref:hypothetical protein n=1 Tax=Larkinella arboricola TaxID=643671 RepID=UPI0011BA941F|nr:hypothetical protein [Larkinella arboricola]
MRLAQVSRSQKVKILHELVNGRSAPIRSHYQSRERDFSKMTDAEIKAKQERIRKKIYRETGIMPPPLPDFEALTDEELRAHADNFRHAIANPCRKD